MATNKRLSATITIGGAVSSTLGSAFGNVKGKIGELGRTITDLTRRQKLLGSAIQEFGRSGKDVDGLRNSYSKLTAQIDRARQAQTRLMEIQKRSIRIAEGIGGAAIGVRAAVGGVGLTARPIVGAAIKRENVVTAIRNSGVSKEDGDAMISAAENAKQFGVSITKATDTVSELRTALGDAHHAIEALPTALKAISGLSLYDRIHHTDLASGDSAYQMAKVAEERGGAASPEAMREKYNWSFKALTGSNGKVTIADQLLAQRAGKGAAQAMSDEAFFGDTFLQQSMGADRYGTSSSTLVNAWIGGHQKHTAFDHLLEKGLMDRGGIKFDKNGRVKTVSPNALVDAELFLKDPQKWVDKHLAPQARKEGVDLEDPAAVMKFVNAITSNPNAANMLLSRLRFSANIWKDRHNVMQANGVEESDKVNKQSTQGKIDNARARLDDAEERMGKILLPLLADSMEKAASALEKLTEFAKESPTAFKVVTYGIIGVTGALTGLAAVGMVSMAANISTLATSMATLSGAMGAADAAAAGAVGGGLGKLLGLFARVGGVATAAVAIPNLTTDQEDEELKNGGDRMKALREKYGQQTIDAARKKYQPWYQFGRGYAGENEEWVKKYTAEQKTLPTPAAKAGGGSVDNSVKIDNLHIIQQPGQDSKALADVIMREIQKRQATKSRSIMFDGASQ
jgi:hypothetical protein